MPIFNLRCEECGKHFERILKREEIQAEKCPECGLSKLTQLISNFGSYSIRGDNSASTRPKGGGGFKK